MSWNYRIVKKIYSNKCVTEPETIYEIREVYYNKEKNIEMIGSNSYIMGTSLDEVVQSLHRMLDGCKDPIIDYDTLKEVN